MFKKHRFLIIFCIGILLLLTIIGYLVTRTNLSFPGKNYKISIPGKKEYSVKFPVSVRLINTATAYFPGCLVSIKGGTEKFEMNYTAFEIIYPDGKNILIDTCVTDEFLQKMLSNYNGEIDKNGQNNFIKSAKVVEYIIFTHEHSDHLSGLKLLSDSLVLEKCLFSKEQINSIEFPVEWIPERLINKFKQFSFDKNGYYQLKPGVTLINTPGHTIGSLSIFIQLQNNQTLLLFGDCSWSYKAFIQRSLKPVFLSKFILKENRNKLINLLNYFNTIKSEVLIIPSHDGEYLDRLIQENILFR